MLGNYWKVLLVCLLPLAASNAQEVCVAMADNAYIKANRGSPDDKLELQQRINEFINLAKKSQQKDFNMKQLVSQFSRFDASQSHLQEELKDMPDKFSLYSGIERHDVMTVLNWGKYKIAVVQYQYQGQVIEEAQAFFCSSGGCRISNMLERAKAPEKIALRFIHRLKFSQWQGETCPQEKPSYSILPTLGPAAATDPLQVFVQYSLGYGPLNAEQLSQEDALLKASMGSFYRCIKRVRQYSIDDLYADTSYGEVKAFLSECTVNMGLGAMVPVLRDSTVTYLPPISLIKVLQSQQLEPLAGVSESGVNYKVYGIKNDNQSIKTLFVLPLVGNSSSKIDWEYFNRDFSYLLLTPQFKRLVSTS